MRRMLILLLALLALSACAAPAEAPEEVPPPQEAPAAPVEPEAPADETEDHVLLTLEAPLSDGRTLTLEAVGRELDDGFYGVREVRVLDGEALLQTAPARDAIERYWGYGESADEYTACWSPDMTLVALDLNFDGNTDFGLFGWPANNTIPYHYWIWDGETGRYRYAFTAQGSEVRPKAKEFAVEYKSGSAGSQWISEIYKPDEHGSLVLDRVERSTCDFVPKPPSYLDAQRGWAEETWVPPEGREPISPGDQHWRIELSLVLTRREVPVYEDNGDGIVSHYTEIWERKDGELQLTSREEYVYEDHQ